MKSQTLIWAIRCLACLGCLVCVSGCSASFGGVRLGGDKELTFTCGEGLPVSDTDDSPEAVKSSAVSSEKEERQEAVPASETESGAADASPGEETADGKVDLNTAGVEELMTLNGIGETRAKAIIEYRTQNGSFTKEEEIMQVPGIKEGIYTKIQDQIIVR